MLAALFFLGATYAKAEPAPQIAEAEALDCTLLDDQGMPQWALGDANRTTKLQWPGGTLTVEAEEAFYGLYLIWDTPPGEWSGQAEGQSISGGKYGFIHEYIPLEAPAARAELTLPQGAICCDVYALGAGTPPDWVQQWEPPLEDADLLVLPTHADDEHLFFGGTMPFYAGEQGRKVQVAYLTHHWGEPYRPHELLNGLWTVGIRSYPVISDFADQYAGSLEEARTLYAEEEVLAYQVELLRRFKPEVVVGHDLNGEYGHGVHMYNADTLCRAVEISADAAQYPESAQAYGVWDVPKTYLHLYPENPCVMDWNVPLEHFDGKTALEMAKLGFEKHVSQQTFFAVEDFGPYDCRRFGLYRTTVGPDVAGGDFFENLTAEDYSDYVPPEPPAAPEPSSGQQTGEAPEEMTGETVQQPDENTFSFFWIWPAAGGLILAGTIVYFVIKGKRRTGK